MLWEVDGVAVGHWTDEAAATGCTVALFPEGTVASGEIRGGAPATREFGLLEPQRMVDQVDAVVLSGGSAFGLAAADGVVAWCEEHDRGFATSAGRVPIVVGMSLFDLAEGSGDVRPDAAAGRLAAEAASAGASAALGRVGAGRGATISKWRDPDAAKPGGLGGAVARSGDVVVAALIAVNASGDIDDGSVAAEIFSGSFVAPESTDRDRFENTTIGVIATNATLDKGGCRLVAESAHDGYAKALLPSHTLGDGDAVVAAATGTVAADLHVVRLLATVVTEAAIRSIAQH